MYLAERVPFFEQIFRKIKEIQPVSTTGALAHTYYWLTFFGSGDLVFRNPNFRAPKEHAPDLSEGIAIYCTHGTADQAGAFDRIAQRLIAAGLPELVSSIAAHHGRQKAEVRSPR